LAKEDDAELVRTGHELRALGLLKSGVDLGRARDLLLGSAIVGFYDPETAQLVVRGARLSPYVRTTLAHEITHALQDQNFHINHPEYDKAEDEIGIGFSAIAEGDALRVEETYRSSMSKRDQQDAAAEERKAAGNINPKDIPLVLSQLLVFPYTEGPQLVSALVKAGGQARLDSAFTKPPTTTEQVMHPEKFLAGEGPKPPADPPADASAIDKGVMGELLLKLLLATVMSSDGAAKAAAGWGGDRYVAWTQGELTCMRVAFTMDTPTDLQELRSGLSQWVAKQKSATLSPADPPVLTNCA
jgi:NACalpha-BTF3-like transcription factor